MQAEDLQSWLILIGTIVGFLAWLFSSKKTQDATAFAALILLVIYTLLLI